MSSFDNFDPLNLGNSSQKKDIIEPEELPKIKAEKPKQKRSSTIKRRHQNTYRRAFSETQLLDICDMPFKDGDSYHFITGGDVDALSYLKIILRQQDLDYCLLSSWCMANEDIYQIHSWLKAGKIKKLDAYLGEIFPGSYKEEYKLFKPIVEQFGGRLAIFRNHSKIFAGYGDKFAFGVETSANINTNPRTENGCITIDKGIFEFYKKYFDGIVSFK